MNSTAHLVCFTIDDQRLALRLLSVQRVIRAVEITPLPQAPEIVPGVINVQGCVMPVIDLRRRFGLPPREIRLTDQFIVAHVGQRTAALWVDTVTGVMPVRDQDMVATDYLAPTPQVEGVVKLDDGLVLIQNLEAFLSIGESTLLDVALQKP